MVYGKLWACVCLVRSIPIMSPAPDTSESTNQDRDPSKKRSLVSSLLHLPTNVYLLLLFTTGKGFQLSLSALTLNYYVHSLGYRPDFIGVFSAMPAIGSLVSAVPVGLLADRIGRKPVLLLTAVLTPLFLAACALVTSPFWLLSCAFMQGVVSTAYWVTNLPLLTESTTERQRVGVLALNSFLLLGIGSLGSLLGGAIPEVMAGILHVSAASTLALRWGVFAAALFTFVFGLPLWFLREPKRTTVHRATDKATKAVLEENVRSSGPLAEAVLHEKRERLPVTLFVKLLVPDLLFTMGEGAVVALMQLFFILRFHLLPGPLGIIFTISGLAGGIFSLTAPLFVKRWSKLCPVSHCALDGADRFCSHAAPGNCRRVHPLIYAHSDRTNLRCLCYGTGFGSPSRNTVWLLFGHVEHRF